MTLHERLLEEELASVKAERDRYLRALERLDRNVEPGWRQATIDLALRPLATETKVSSGDAGRPATAGPRETAGRDGHERDGDRLAALLAGPNTHPPHYLRTDQLVRVTGLSAERVRGALRAHPGVEERDDAWRRTR